MAMLRGLRHAFALEPDGELTAKDRDLLVRIAGKVVDRQMALPAVLCLESLRPLNFIGSQALVFLRPFLTPWCRRTDYDRVVSILDRREGIRCLVRAIEAARAAAEESRP
jgi:hypothetical protein